LSSLQKLDLDDNKLTLSRMLIILNLYKFQKSKNKL
jgi:hypothetical protein